jgi:hypothetical protein
MSQFITDPVEIGEELHKWKGKEVTAYIALNPHTELAVLSKLDKTPTDTWRVSIGTQTSAAAILFGIKGITRLVKTDTNRLQVVIDLSLPNTAPTGEFS